MCFIKFEFLHLLQHKYLSQLLHNPSAMDVETLKSTISDEMKKSPAYNQLINLIKSGSSISPPLPNLGVTKMKKASLYLRVRLGQGSVVLLLE